jgi:hypothetical protein
MTSLLHSPALRASAHAASTAGRPISQHGGQDRHHLSVAVFDASSPTYGLALDTLCDALAFQFGPVDGNGAPT